MERKCDCCGKLITKIPDDNKFVNNGDAFDGVYFNCECGSTHFIPISQIKEE